MQKKILFFTGKRGGINHFIPLIKKINKSKNFSSSILFTDMHISKFFGETYNEFKNLSKDIHFVKSISNKIDGSKLSRSRQIPRAMEKIITKLKIIKPYSVVVLGDRSELFSIAIPCLILNIPLIHLYGGDISEGSTDNATRFSISMLSNYHLVSNSTSYKKLIKFGINKNKIFNVGLLSLHQIPKKTLPKEKLFKKLSISPQKKTIIIIFHPETYFLSDLKKQIKSILLSLKTIDANKVFIYPCSDPGYDIIVKNINLFCSNDKNSYFFRNLKNELFYSLYAKSDLIMGNSSSGILESCYLSVPALNIGDRQKGRHQTKNIINSGYNPKKLKSLIEYSLNDKKLKMKIKKLKSDYYNTNSINKCYDILTKIDMTDKKILINSF